MSTLTLDRPKRKIQQQKIVLNVSTCKYNFLMELLENFNFVQIEKDNDDSRKEIIANLKETAKDLKLIKTDLKPKELKEIIYNLKLDI